MANIHVLQRLGGIQKQLMAAHHAGITMSNASKGREREDFIDGFLSRVLPPIYRFGTGDATDRAGQKSGQLDVVIEYPFGPSLPALGTGQTRLYLAETVAAVVEVKSSLPQQIQEAQHTLAALTPLTRFFSASMTMGMQTPPQIPLFLVGYKGWKTEQTVVQHVNANPGLCGILVVEEMIFAASPQFGGMVATGPSSLMGLIACLHRATASLQAAHTNPMSYAI